MNHEMSYKDNDKEFERAIAVIPHIAKPLIHRIKKKERRINTIKNILQYINEQEERYKIRKEVYKRQGSNEGRLRQIAEMEERYKIRKYNLNQELQSVKSDVLKMYHVLDVAVAVLCPNKEQ